VDAQRLTLAALSEMSGADGALPTFRPAVAPYEQRREAGVEVEAAEVTLAQFINASKYASKDTTFHRRMYVFQPLPRASALRPLWRSPPWLPRSVEQRRRNLQFYAGSAGTGAPWHWHTSALNVQFSGRKRWRFKPPARAVWAARLGKVDVAGAIKRCEGGRGGAGGGGGGGRGEADDACAAPASDAAEEEAGGDDAGDVVMCEQRAHEAVWVPPSWAHETLNLQMSHGLAAEFDTG